MATTYWSFRSNARRKCALRRKRANSPAAAWSRFHGGPRERLKPHHPHTLFAIARAARAPLGRGGVDRGAVVGGERHVGRADAVLHRRAAQIGRASCRESVCQYV